MLDNAPEVFRERFFGGNTMAYIILLSVAAIVLFSRYGRSHTLGILCILALLFLKLYNPDYFDKVSLYFTKIVVFIFFGSLCLLIYYKYIK